MIKATLPWVTEIVWQGDWLAPLARDIGQLCSVYERLQVMAGGEEATVRVYGRRTERVTVCCRWRWRRMVNCVR